MIDEGRTDGTIHHYFITKDGNTFIVDFISQNDIKDFEEKVLESIKFYMNYVDKNIKSINHDKTIGIILCKKENELVLKYTSDDRIYSREYLLV